MKAFTVKIGLILTSLILLVSAGCSSILGPDPREATREWYAALGEFDAAQMYQLTHPEPVFDIEQLV